MSAEHRSDPRWIEAHSRYVDDLPGESDGEALVRRIRAAFDLREIEAEYARGGAA